MKMCLNNQLTFWQFAAALRIKSNLCDVEFHVQDTHGNKKILLAHKIIMMYYSGYLYILLSKDWRKKVYHLSQVSPSALQSLIQLLYKEIPLVDFVTDKDAVAAAEILDIDLHDKLCNIFLQKHYPGETLMSTESALPCKSEILETDSTNILHQSSNPDEKNGDASMDLECNISVKDEIIDQNAMTETHDEDTGQSDETCDNEIVSNKDLLETYDEHEYCMKTKNIDKHEDQNELHSDQVVLANINVLEKPLHVSTRNENSNQSLEHNQVVENENIYRFLQASPHDNETGTENQKTNRSNILQEDNQSVVKVEPSTQCSSVETSNQNININTDIVCTNSTNTSKKDKNCKENNKFDDNIIIDSSLVNKPVQGMSEPKVKIHVTTNVNNTSTLKTNSHVKNVNNASTIKLVQSRGNVFKFVSMKPNSISVQSDDKNSGLNGVNSNVDTNATVIGSSNPASHKDSINSSILECDEQLLQTSIPEENQQCSGPDIVAETESMSGKDIKFNIANDSQQSIKDFTEDQPTLSDEDEMEQMQIDNDDSIDDSIEEEESSEEIDKSRLIQIHKYPPLDLEKCKGVFYKNPRKKRGPFTCEYCKKVIQTYSMYERHLRNHTGEQPFMCNICGRKFTRKGNMLMHLKLHEITDKNFQCETCFATFKTQNNLKNHIKRVHIENEDIECPHCQSKFKSKYTFKQHLTYKHNKTGTVECEECGRQFDNDIYLKRHMLTHSEEKPFKCKLCDQSFRSHGSRSSHMTAVHSQDKAICEVCGKSYNSKAVMLAHYKRVHESAPPRECPVCRKVVVNYHNHMRMHRSYEKGDVFHCTECYKTFPMKMYLQQHMNVHKNKRFQCEKCEKFFTFKASLKSHEKSCGKYEEGEQVAGTSLLQNVKFILPPTQHEPALQVAGLTVITRPGENSTVNKNSQEQDFEDSNSQRMFVVQSKQSLVSSDQTRLQLHTGKKRSLLSNSNWTVPTSLKQSLLTNPQISLLSNNKRSLLANQTLPLSASFVKREDQVLLEKDQEDAVNQSLISILNQSVDQPDSFSEEIGSDVNFTEGSNITQDQMMLQEQQIMITQEQDDSIIQGVSQGHLMLQELPEDVNEQEMISDGQEEQVLLQEVPQEQLLLQGVSEQDLTEKSVVVQGVSGQELSQEDLASMLTGTEEENVQYVCILTE